MLLLTFNPGLIGFRTTLPWLLSTFSFFQEWMMKMMFVSVIWRNSLNLQNKKDYL